MSNFKLNKLAKIVFKEAQNRGWFEGHWQEEHIHERLSLSSDGDDDSADEAWKSVDYELPRFGSKVNSEVAELWEAYRSSSLHEPCDKMWPDGQPIGLSCTEEELADILIVVLEFAGFMGIDLDRAVDIKRKYNKSREIKERERYNKADNRLSISAFRTRFG
jgi:NTP pyrophosphatase (non-canonical NTP hydrolase)